MNGEQTLVFLLDDRWYVWRLLDDEELNEAGEIARGCIEPHVAIGHEVRGRNHAYDAWEGA